MAWWDWTTLNANVKFKGRLLVLSKAERVRQVIFKQDKQRVLMYFSQRVPRLLLANG